MRFFLDTSDGRRFYRDDTGEDYPSVVSAYHAATIALAELAQDNLPDNGTERDLSVAVRNHLGEPLFTVSLSFRLAVTAAANAEDLGLQVAPPKPQIAAQEELASPCSVAGARRLDARPLMSRLAAERAQ